MRGRYQGMTIPGSDRSCHNSSQAAMDMQRGTNGRRTQARQSAWHVGTHPSSCGRCFSSGKTLTQGLVAAHHPHARAIVQFGVQAEGDVHQRLPRQGVLVCRQCHRCPVVLC